VKARGASRDGALALFTRDLRVRDQQALVAAVRGHEHVVPAFVLDDRLIARVARAPNRLAFLLECLRDLDDSLADRGARLVLRRGDVVEQALALAAEHDLHAIHMSCDVTPYARERHERLAEACAKARVALHTHPGITVVAPDELTPAGGDHYRVFTPYWRAWNGLARAPVLRAPTRIDMPPGVRATPLPERSELTGASPASGLQSGGESAARERLARWLASSADDYEELRDDLGAGGSADGGTSRLSAYLHFGCLSPRALLARCGRESFARQLCWRDFHHQVLAARPEIPHSDYRPRGDRWRRDARAAAAWREGRTGYPIVDAAMRQLAAEGYMHNRARLIVGSFLTKTLYLDWRLGATHFASHLLDADVANNVGNWQWVAGTGTDTRPNRVLSPIRQAKRFDPHGDYVRRWLPELAGAGDAALHEPWRLPRSRGGSSYPPPIVDHQRAAAEFRSRRSAG
jgi:deoxyribodipyrimidine photo-lyase